MSFQDWPVLRCLDASFLETVRVAFVFGHKGNEALMIADDQKMYGCGSNMSGCLGMRHKAAISNHKLVPDLENKIFLGIACGGDFRNNNVFVVTHFRGGEIYQWGKIPCWRALVLSPQRVNNFMNIKVEVLTCGFAHCAVLTADGQVFTWGANDVGQLGHDECKMICGVFGSRVPGRVKGILEEKHVVRISCGARFTVAVFDDGKVVAWGSNSCGQLGIDSTVSFSACPVELKLLNGVVIDKIICGSAHVLALSNTHDLFTWGDNSFSQLGFSSPPQNKNTHFFAKPNDYWITNQKKFVDIYASYVCELSVARSEDGKFYMWGRTSSGNVCLPRNSGCSSIHQLFAFHANPPIMPNPLRRVLEAKRRNTLLNTLEQKYNKLDGSDFTVIVEGEKIHVHRAILSMRSEYFNAILSRWLKPDENVITIKEKSYKVVEPYIRYLYTDQVDADLNFAAELLQLADEYADDSFKTLCEMKIQRDMTLEKVADILDLSSKLPTCSDLTKYCLDIALRHPVEIINSPGFKNWDANTLELFLVEYIKKKESQLPPANSTCYSVNCLCQPK